MEKKVKIGYTTFKVYDFFVLALLIIGTILLASINGAFQLGIPSVLIGPIVIFLELIYIFKVVNQRPENKK